MLALQHSNEIGRLDSLRRHALIDTGSDSRFNRLIYMAAQILRAPISTISIIDEDRQWFKAAIGVLAKETSRADAFCAHTILGDDMMIVEDTHRDFRFAANPLVTGAPFIRFYAGVPLHCRDGFPLGAICAIDTQPRTLTAEQKHSLLLLGREAEDLVQSTEFG